MFKRTTLPFTAHVALKEYVNTIRVNLCYKTLKYKYDSSRRNGVYYGRY